MTDDTSPETAATADDESGPLASYDFENDPDGLTAEDFRGDEDLLLSVLLAVVPGEADSDASVGVTVTVGGVVISGKAVSFAHWSKLWTAEVTRAHEGMGGGLRAALEGWVQERADFISRREAEDRPVPDPAALCLADAKILNGPHTYRAGLMRVRRSQIDAWSLGEPAE
ncbi:hypothetical protein [Segeticoccus rhizosphaerae]|uniref:hypothetical protein n=1 Tax=Segeticoccus rhizosphaerae TaxID=1104777 RepID=UPI00126566CC|nr:hypothetical protein [Segeticoccus rhizosphaerae]